MGKSQFFWFWNQITRGEEANFFLSDDLVLCCDMITFVVVFAIITIIQDSTIIVPAFSAPAHVVFPSTRHWRNWETLAEGDGED